MRTQPAFRYFLSFITVIGLVGIPVAAQTPVPGTTPDQNAFPETLNVPDDDAAEAPAETGATYGRLLHYEGSIFVRREGGDQSGQVNVAQNTPIIPGDQIWTGEDGRVEVQLADGSIVRLDVNSRLTFLNLADTQGEFDNTTLLRLLNGSVYVKTVKFDPRQRRFQVDTPAGSIFALSEGVFRVDVANDGVSTLASYRGVAEVISNEHSVIAHSGERLTVAPDRTPGEARAFNTLRRDDFDVWSDSRDDVLAGGTVEQGPAPDVPDTVKPYMSELNRNGVWRYDDTYGWVWVPDDVSTDWRPYYYGQWDYSPIGPVWVSYEPWGWAPYHYGRWQFTVGLGWFWSPGIVFSGAYVAWAVGPSYFSWCPLGFYDYPVVYRSYSPWVYIPYTSIYQTHVYRHAYSSAYVSAHRFAASRIILRRHPRVGPGYRLERSGANIYRSARQTPALVAATSAAAGNHRRVSFKNTEQMAYRRIVASRARPETASRGILARPSRSLPGRAGAVRPGTPRAGEVGGLRTRPVANRFSRDRGVVRSPVTGRSMQPTVKITPPGERGSSRVVRPPAPREGRGTTARRPVTRNQATPGTLPRTRSGDPHPKVDQRGSNAGPRRFVMPTRATHPPVGARRGGTSARAHGPAQPQASHNAPARSQGHKSGKKGGKH